MVALHNHSKKAETVAVGERIAQLVVTPFLRVEFCESDTLGDTERGAGGFGSTGTTAIAAGETKASGESEASGEATASDEPSAPAIPDAATLREEALALYHGMGAPFDRRAAVAKLREAANAGDSLCAARLAYLRCIGDELADIPVEREAGIEALTDLLAPLEAEATAETPDAMLLLGHLLVDGLGVEKDDHRAAELYYRAAELGYAPAANALGQCYSFAVGVRLDAVRAVGCYRRAAEADGKHPHRRDAVKRSL